MVAKVFYLFGQICKFAFKGTSTGVRLTCIPKLFKAKETSKIWENR